MAATSINRLQGRYGIATLAGFHLTLFEWEAEIRTEFVDGTGHGDIWDVPVPLKYLWTARLRGRFDNGGGNHTYLYSAYNAQVSSTPPDISPIAFIGYNSMTTGSGGTQIFSANGYVVRAHWTASAGSMVEQEVECRGSGIPTAIDHVIP